LLDTRDHGLLTRWGVLWRSSLAGLRRLIDEPLTYGQTQTDFTPHLMPASDSSLVMATAVSTTCPPSCYWCRSW
jgi:hypothetical protein